MSKWGSIKVTRGVGVLNEVLHEKLDVHTPDILKRSALSPFYSVKIQGSTAKFSLQLT